MFQTTDQTDLNYSMGFEHHSAIDFIQDGNWMNKIPCFIG